MYFFDKADPHQRVEIDVIGHCGGGVEATTALAVSLRRAQAVCAFLQDGVPHGLKLPVFSMDERGARDKSSLMQVNLCLASSCKILAEIVKCVLPKILLFRTGGSW